MDEPRGRRLPIPPSRALVIDLLHYDRKAPMVAHSRVCNLAEAADARAGCRRRISWAVLFLKAYAHVAADTPPLRRCYLRWPWPHFYQHPTSVGTLAINRRHDGAERLCWARFPNPHQRSLVDLQQTLDERYKRLPVEQVFRRQVILSRFPWPLRRAAWALTLNLSGARRAKRLGTFGLTTLAAEGAEIHRPPSPLATTLTYGPLDRAARSRVTIAYDHRVMDGALVARVLARIEGVLCGLLSAELRSIAAGGAGPPVARSAA
jgi:hypothetical protein